MKRKTIYQIFAVAAFCAVFMTGCSQGVELTTEQNDIIANYAARLIARATYVDYTYIPDIKEPALQDTTEPGDTRTPEEIAEENEEKYKEFASFFDMGGLVVSYKDTIISDEYPVDENALFVLPAENGSKLVVVEFNMFNPMSESISYTTGDDVPVFRLVLDEKTAIRSFKNILPNDLSNMKDFTIESGESSTAIIVFQVDEEAAAKLNRIKVQYNNNGTYTDLPLYKAE